MKNRLHLFLSMMITISICMSLFLYIKNTDLKKELQIKTESIRKIKDKNSVIERERIHLEERVGELQKQAEHFSAIKAELGNFLNKSLLFKSILSNDQEIINIYLKLGFEPNVSDKDGNTALILACLSKNRTAIRNLLEHGADIDAHNKKGSTALMLATVKGYIHIASLLLEAGANTEEKDFNGFTALFHAVKNSPEFVPLLLSHGAKTDVIAKHGDTLLMFSCRYSSIDTISLLIRAGADITKADKNGVTSLVIAVGRKNLELVNLLVSAGIDINKNNYYGNTALMVAIKNGDYAIVKALIDAGADIHRQGRSPGNSLIVNSESLLSLAVKAENEKIIALLLDSGVDLNAKSGSFSPPNTRGILFGGDTSFIEAAKTGNSSVVEQLIKAGAEVDAQNNQGKTALTYAVEKEHLAVIKKLIEAGASTTIQDKHGLAPLVKGMSSSNTEILELFFQIRQEKHLEIPPQVVISASCGRPEVLERLIKEGAEVNVANKKGYTPLMAAAGRSEITTQMLISSGADVNALDFEGKSALTYAVEKHRLNNVKLLLQAGADSIVIGTATSNAVERKDNTILEFLLKSGVNVNPSEGNSPLSSALNTSVRNGEEQRISTMLLLIRAGADVNHKGQYFDITPLMTAVVYGHHESVKFLLNNGANVNDKLSYHGTTVLMYAVEKTLATPDDQVETIKILLDHGADINAVDRKGETALMKAIQKKNNPVIKVLSEAGEGGKTNT